MKIIGIIPARWASTRFEGKVLAVICGKPMVQHIWERSRESKILDDVIIACDDKRVMDAAGRFGAKTVLTRPDHPSGTDRIAEAAASLSGDIFVNIQADEPLMDHSVIDALAQALADDPASLMATVIKRIDSKNQLQDPNVVKAVVDGHMNALYFSRSAIPFNRDNSDVIYYKHLGIYAYRKDFLMTYKDLPRSNLEQAERLEQLRALECGFKIKTVLTDIETVGVDTPEDLAIVEKILSG